MTITTSSDGATARTRAGIRVERALQIHRSIAACHAHISHPARNGGIHAHTAALMLPCYQAGFLDLVFAMTAQEARELRYLLEAPCESAA